MTTNRSPAVAVSAVRAAGSDLFLFLAGLAALAAGTAHYLEGQL